MCIPAGIRTFNLTLLPNEPPSWLIINLYFRQIFKCLTNIPKFTKIWSHFILMMTSQYERTIPLRNLMQKTNKTKIASMTNTSLPYFLFLSKNTLVCFIVARCRIRWRGWCRKSESGAARRRKNGKSNIHDHKFQGRWGC